MSVNGIGNSAASWAQFVKLTQAARTRNSGLGADGAVSAKSTPTAQSMPAVSTPTTQSTPAVSATSALQNVNAVSFKRVADVYLTSTQSARMPMPIRNESLNRKVAGGLFDAYA